MTKKLFCGLAMVCALSGLLFTPGAYSQESNDSRPAEKAAAGKGKSENKIVRGDPCQLSACVNKVLYFSSLTQPTELQDAINTLRTILDANRLTQIPWARAVVLRGTPEQVAEAETLAAEIDNAKRRFGAGYRLNITVSELQGEQKLSSKSYSLVTETREVARLNLGSKSMVQPQEEEEPGSKPPEAGEVGQRIQCRIVSESESSVVLHLSAHLLKPGSHSRGDSAAAQFKVEDTFPVELGKTTVVSSLDDPDSGRRYRLEATATRMEEKQ
jgi:hypothetical protein